MDKLTQKHERMLRGVLSCYDRVIIQGTLPGICYAKGMTSFLRAEKIRIFDYPDYAKNLRDQIRAHAAKVAADAGVEIVFVKNKNVRKEQMVAEILKHRGNVPGLVTILAAMESCPAYKPWHNKVTHQTYLKQANSQCLHYYFYLFDEILGLIYVRVPTWCPFRLQIYFNGHN